MVAVMDALTTALPIVQLVEPQSQMRWGSLNLVKYANVCGITITMILRISVS